MRKLPFKIKIYLISIYLITSVSIALSIKINFLNLQIADYKDIIFFAILMALTETFTVSFRKISFSTSFAIQLASFILFGPLTTSFIIILGFSIRVVKMPNNKYSHILNTPYYGTLSNYCTLILPIIYGNYFYLVLNGEYPINTISNNILPIVIFSIVCFFVNTIIISILASVASGKNFIYCFISNIRLGFLNILALAPFGIILAVIFEQYSYSGVILTLFPVVLARYTFSLYIDTKNQFVQTVDSLMRAMEARDKYTEGHSQRVAHLAVKIAKVMKYNDIKIEQLNIAALLHDVGKIGIDDQILNKPGKLTDEEFTTIKNHPAIGYNILKDVKDLEKIVDVVKYHHERYDGKGYPDGKSKEDLSIDIFIIQLADSIDAMATDRPYRKALSEDEILREVKRCSGTQFHPKVVEAYLKLK